MRRGRPVPGLIAGLLLLVPPAARPEELGRLFFTAQARNELEQQRREQPSRASPPPDSPMRINGVVRRSSGRITFWINGKPMHDSRAWKAVTESSTTGAGE